MLNTVFIMALVIISVSILGCLYRAIKGPTIPDRVIALDLIGVNLIAIVAIGSMLLRTSVYLDIILLIGILAFLGTIAISKFIEKGVVLEHDSSTRDDR